MVYIKMTPEMWILSGLEKIIPVADITIIDNNRYIPYQIFKQASKQVQHPIHTMIRRQHIIPNTQFTKLHQQSQLTAQQKQQKLQLKMKHQLRMLNHIRSTPSSSSSPSPSSLPNIKSQTYYFEQKKDQSIKDMSKSVSFGMTFIFSFFMAGLTGYYVGIYFIGLAFESALIVAVFFIMGTIVIETALFIIKQNRDDRIKAKKSKEKYRDQFVRPSYSEYKRRMEKQEVGIAGTRPKTQ